MYCERVRHNTNFFSTQANGSVSIIDLADSDTTAMNGAAPGRASATQDTAGTPPAAVSAASPAAAPPAAATPAPADMGDSKGVTPGRDDSAVDARPSCYSSQQTPGGEQSIGAWPRFVCKQPIGCHANSLCHPVHPACGFVCAGAKSAGVFSESAVEAITAIGFTRKQAERALWMTHGDADRAAAWLADQAS